jgi:hypothetical protein
MILAGLQTGCLSYVAILLVSSSGPQGSVLMPSPFGSRRVTSMQPISDRRCLVPLEQDSIFREKVIHRQLGAMGDLCNVVFAMFRPAGVGLQRTCQQVCLARMQGACISDECVSSAGPATTRDVAMTLLRPVRGTNGSEIQKTVALGPRELDT